MKIALVAEWLDPARGGAETSTRQFIDALLERDISLHVFTRSEIPAGPHFHVETVSTRAPGRAASTAEFMRRVESAIRETDCALIHALTPCVGADCYQPRGGLVAETILRTAATRRAPLARGFKQLLMKCNARQRMMLSKERGWLTGDRRPVVIALSEYVARQLEAHYNYPRPLIHHVLNGVTVRAASEGEREDDRRTLRARHSIGDATLTLLTVCHNFRLKGVGSLIEALSLLMPSTRQDLRALVVGRENPKPWRRLARRKGVDEMLVFTGPVENTVPYFHAADALIHPTYYDPCSRVVLEAVATGLPVVCTRFDGASEAIEDGATGYVVDSPDDTRALAERIRSLADPRVRKSLSRGTCQAAKFVSMARHADEVVALYRSLCDGPRPVSRAASQTKT